MTSRDFCYWLQGFFELGKIDQLTPEQTELVRRHLALVFRHEIDPSFPVEQQKSLNSIHQGNYEPPCVHSGESPDGGVFDNQTGFRC